MHVIMASKIVCHVVNIHHLDKQIPLRSVGSLAGARVNILTVLAIQIFVPHHKDVLTG